MRTTTPAALLHSLRTRYERGEFFSNIGPDCLVWISPGGPDVELLGVRRMQLAAAAAAPEQEPHVFALGERHMRRKRILPESLRMALALAFFCTRDLL